MHLTLYGEWMGVWLGSKWRKWEEGREWELGLICIMKIDVIFNLFLFICLFFDFLNKGFSLALEPVLELALVSQAGLEFIEICPPLPPKCWD